MEENQYPKVDNYKEKVKSQAEDLILKEFPQKILELENLLKTEKFNQKNLSSIHSDLNIPIPGPELRQNHDDDASGEPVPKKRKSSALNDCSNGVRQPVHLVSSGDSSEDDLCVASLDDDLSSQDERSDDISEDEGLGTLVSQQDVAGLKVMALPNGGKIPSNKKILEIVDIVKPKIKQLVEDANLLKMWIQFLIPRIEDGNNFGVSIQEDTLGEIRTVESEAATFYDQISRYFLTRGKIVARVAKYPYIDDFRRTVQELDEKEYISMWLMVCELRNHYAALHDLITKNMEKIKKPRSSNTETMY